MTDQMLVHLNDGRELSILKPRQDRLQDSIEVGVTSIAKACAAGEMTDEEGALTLLYGLVFNEPFMSVLGDGINRFEVAVRKDGIKKGLAPDSWKEWLVEEASRGEYDIFGYVPRRAIQALMDEVGVTSVENPHWEADDADSGLRGPEVEQPVSGEVHAHDTVEAPERAAPDH